MRTLIHHFRSGKMPGSSYSNFYLLRLKPKKSREFYMDAFLERSKYLT